MPGNHPIVPVMIRNKTLVTDIVKYLAGRGVLAVGIKPPIVPEGEENLRFQVSASHTTLDLGQVLGLCVYPWLWFLQQYVDNM